jgi:hypothetical protein
VTKIRASKTAEENKGYYGVEPVMEKEGMGETRVVKERMKAPAQLPCRECPLRQDSAPGFLGGYTPEMYLTLLHGRASVACHCSKGFHSKDISQQRHCTGVVGYRANQQILTRTAADEATRELADSYPRNLREDFFTSMPDFYYHHKPAQTAAACQNDEAPNYPADWGHDEDEN